MDSKQNKVMVKGPKADPSKVLERLQGKYSRNVELISPKLKPSAQDKKEPEKKQVVRCSSRTHIIIYTEFNIQ